MEFDASDVAMEIRIVMTKQGQVLFTLPNGSNLLMVYGLLEAAKDAAKDEANVRMQQANEAIAIASVLPPHRNGSGLRRV